jgi:hypothetical protein
MSRTAILSVLSLFLAATCPVGAEDISPGLHKELGAWLAECGRRGSLQEPPKGLRKLMPKDQVDVIERAGAVARLRLNAQSETNGLKKKEATDKASQMDRELKEDLGRIVSTGGLDKWVFVYGLYNDSDNEIRVVASDLVTAVVQFQGMGEEVKKAVRALKPGDLIRVTTEGDPKAKQLNNHMPFQIRGSVITAVETVK